MHPDQSMLRQVCWGDLALRMATLFGLSYGIRTLSGVLALQVGHQGEAGSLLCRVYGFCVGPRDPPFATAAPLAC